MRSIVFASERESLPENFVLYPKVRFADQTLKEGTQVCDRTISFRIQQNTQDALRAHPASVRHGPAATIIHQQEIGTALLRKNQCFCLSLVDYPAHRRDLSSIPRHDDFHPITNRIQGGLAWQTLLQFGVNRGRNEDPAVEAGKKIQFPQRGKIDQRRGVAHDDHQRPKLLRVSMSCSKSSTVYGQV